MRTSYAPRGRRQGQLRPFLGAIAVALCGAWPAHLLAADATALPLAATVQSGARYYIVPLSDDRLAFGARINAKGQVSYTDLFGPDPGVYRGRFFDRQTLFTLPTFGGNNSFALALNRSGDVTGYADLTPGGGERNLFHAFRWSKDRGMTDIASPAVQTSYGADISDKGQIAGAALFGATGDAVHAARWSAQNSVLDLGTLAGGVSAASAINEAGTVAGWSEAPQSPALRLPFRWTQERGMQALGTAASESAGAADINAGGDIAGTAALAAGGIEHAFLSTSQGTLIDLGIGSGKSSGATRLNDNAMVIGFVSALPGFGVGFVWTRNTGMIELGKPGVNASTADDLNKHGHVVGGYDGRAYLWTVERGIMDLNTRVRNAPRGLVLRRGWAINDNGAIVAASNTGLVLLTTEAVGNQRPLVGAIDISGAPSAGATLSFYASFTDPDTRDTHKAVWDWGDGRTQTGTLNERSGSGNVSAQHSYEAAGEYTVRLTVTDSSGKSTTVRWDVLVNEAGQCKTPSGAQTGGARGPG